MNETAKSRFRDTSMILIGVFVLVTKKWIAIAFSEIGWSDIVYSYLGNFSVSFAILFLMHIGFEDRISPFGRVLLALAVVESFEFANGFGLMANVYDPFDYLANLLGVITGLLIEAITTRTFFGV